MLGLLKDLMCDIFSMCVNLNYKIQLRKKLVVLMRYSKYLILQSISVMENDLSMTTNCPLMEGDHVVLEIAIM